LVDMGARRRAVVAKGGLREFGFRSLVFGALQPPPGYGWTVSGLVDFQNPYIERQNLTMRMSIRRLTRLTNGFSKKKTENPTHGSVWIVQVRPI